MDDDEQFLQQVLSSVSEADVITIFLPLLHRAIVVDTRHDDQHGQMVKIMPQAGSMEERIRGIERMRPSLGKVESIVGVPWLKSVRHLREKGITGVLVSRLAASGMPDTYAEASVTSAVEQLLKLERVAFVRMIKGEGFRTLWTAGH